MQPLIPFRRKEPEKLWMVFETWFHQMPITRCTSVINLIKEVNKNINYTQLFAMVPLMLNLLKSGPTFRGSSWVCLIPRAWCLLLEPEKESHYQLHVLVWAEGIWELWCGYRTHAAQSHVSVPVYFASGFTCNTCSVIRGFLHITSL